jgi:phospholipid transport system substrate-binding protein
MNKLRINAFTALITLLLSAFWVTTASAASGDPVQLLQNVADQMIQGLKAHQSELKSNPQIAYNLANKYVVPHADLAEMSRRVLPPSVWNSATPAQRAQFQKEFTSTLVRTYASALTAYQDQTVQFYPIRGGVTGQNLVEVKSQITSSSNNQPITVNYRLIRAGNDWKIVDLSVDGVDMLDSFRAQFADILAQKNMDQLLQQMASHNRQS